MDSWQSPALFLCLQDLVVAFIQTFQCSLNEFFGYISLSVWIKKRKSPALLLVNSCLPPVDTLYQTNKNVLSRKILFKKTENCSKSTTGELEKVWNSSKLIMKTPERLQWRFSCIFIVDFEHMSGLFPVFLLLTLNK